MAPANPAYKLHSSAERERSARLRGEDGEAWEAFLVIGGLSPGISLVSVPSSVVMVVHKWNIYIPLRCDSLRLGSLTSRIVASRTWSRLRREKNTIEGG